MACSGDVTFFPLPGPRLPLRRVPWLRLRIARSTYFWAARPYRLLPVDLLAMDIPPRQEFPLHAEAKREPMTAGKCRRRAAKHGAGLLKCSRELQTARASVDPAPDPFRPAARGLTIRALVHRGLVHRGLSHRGSSRPTAAHFRLRALRAWLHAWGRSRSAPRALASASRSELRIRTTNTSNMPSGPASP